MRAGGKENGHGYHPYFPVFSDSSPPPLLVNACVHTKQSATIWMPATDPAFFLFKKHFNMLIVDKENGQTFN